MECRILAKCKCFRQHVMNEPAFILDLKASYNKDKLGPFLFMIKSLYKWLFTACSKKWQLCLCFKKLLQPSCNPPLS